MRYKCCIPQKGSWAVGGWEMIGSLWALIVSGLLSPVSLLESTAAMLGTSGAMEMLFQVVGPYTHRHTRLIRYDPLEPQRERVPAWPHGFPGGV